MPSPCPPHPPRPSVYCTRYPGNLMGRMQIRGTNEAAPCLPSQFTLMMTNTFVHGEGRWELQYASNHCPPEISPLLSLSNPPIPIFLCLFFLFIFLSLSLTQSLHLRIIIFPPFFFSKNFPFPFFVHPSTQGRQRVPQSSPAADVAVVCERSVLSKQTHWAICYSTLHQAGSSEESAHHFNQPRQHTMNL